MRCLWLLLLTIASAARVPQRDALLSLFNAAGGSGWSQRDGWGSDSDECTWFGISCDNGNVATVALPSNALTGGLSAQFFQGMPYLQVLNVGGNNLVAPLPTEIGLLSSLQILKIGFNKISGTIPTEIGQLRAITEFRILANE
jgi:hypothetical protein